MKECSTRLLFGMQVCQSFGCCINVCSSSEFGQALSLLLHLMNTSCLSTSVFCAAAAEGDSGEGLLKDITFYALDSRQETILWDVKPAFVVVYDPDVTFVRQLEVHALMHCSATIKWTPLHSIPTCLPPQSAFHLSWLLLKHCKPRSVCFKNILHANGCNTQKAYRLAACMTHLQACGNTLTVERRSTKLSGLNGQSVCTTCCMRTVKRLTNLLLLSQER